MRESKRAGKHVIFLGAGASVSSGYPTADGLRRLMASQASFSKYVADHLAPDRGSTAATRKIASRFYSQFTQVLEFFRFGGYGSVDEFCYLARGNHPHEVQKLKALISFVLAVHNPEDSFEDSNYYPFIQRLFEPNTDSLRDDICIISFNYDPYLEFLLRRAVETRAKAAKGRDHQCPVDRALLSGFFEGPKGCEDNWQRREGFCVLKLHGTLAVCRHCRGDSRNILTFDDVFGSDKVQKLDRLERKLTGGILPIFFPWEILDEKLEFATVGNDHWKGNRPFDEFESGGLSDLAQQIWERARHEVQRARKVSFVGFSAHTFLNAAFQKLFHGKADRVRLTVANPDRDAYMRVTGVRHPVLHENSSAVRISELLRVVCPKLEVPRSIEMFDHSVSSFKEFIDKEMAPVPVDG